VPGGNGRPTSDKKNALENISAVSLLRLVIAGRPQRFRFVVVVAADGAFEAKGETGAATADFTAFGFRISRLPRRCSLTISSPFGDARRPMVLSRVSIYDSANVLSLYSHE